MAPKRSTTGRGRTPSGAEPPLEPLEPGGEVGETREVGPASSAARLPGRPPRTRVVVHDNEPTEPEQPG